MPPPFQQAGGEFTVVRGFGGVPPQVAKRLLDEVQRNPPCPEAPTKIDLRRFQAPSLWSPLPL